ncbi:hypothetical protein KA005_77370 [bacterium]|nr:hypothetical protein [bacterium]
METQIEKLEIINPNKNWVISELNSLILEWEVWQNAVAEIQDRTYDKNMQTEVFADGEENMDKHEILQAKTLTFLNNNIKGHGFIIGFDGKGCDGTDLRLKIRVKHRLQQLRILQESLKYALVPEAYVVRKVKEITDKIIASGTEAGTRILLEYLKQPM